MASGGNEMAGQQWLIDWEQAAAAGIAACGGKGWNLARLARYGFPVPRGGVLVAEAYRQLLDRCLMGGEAAWLRTLYAESVMDSGVSRELESLRRRILNTPLPEGVEGALVTFLDEQRLLSASLAVRSSAVAEDGEHYSFAGIHESVLNVKGLGPLIDAVRRCYASLWTPRAVAYRRHAGISDTRCDCAVVICRMVAALGREEPRAAGVLFTCDPLTGRRDRLIVNSVAGLADRLVAGAEVPEQSTVSTHLLRYAVTARARSANTPPLPMDNDDLIDLARWGMRAQWAFGDGDLPQDIEWAYDGARFWFLQVRPVTRLPHRSFEGLSSQPVIWSNANLKEVVGGLPTALSWSLIQEVVRSMLFAPLREAGVTIPVGMQTLRRFHGRAYLDLSALQWVYYDGFGYPPDELNRDLGGNQPAIRVPQGDPMKGREGRQRVRRKLRLLRMLRGIGQRLGDAHRETLDRVVAFRKRPLHNMPDEALGALLREWVDYGIGVSHLFQLSNSDAGVWLQLTRELLTRLNPEETEELLGSLLAAGGEMPSVEALHHLHTLANLAAADPAVRRWLGALPAEGSEASAFKGVSLSTAPFRSAFERYLELYGHRALNETELASPRWHEAPRYLLREIARLVDAAEGEMEEAARARREEGEEGLRRLPWWSRPLVRWLAARARRGMARRETGKSLSVAALEPVRRIALEVGRRMSERSVLQRPDQVFQLALADLEALLAGTWNGTGAAALAADREELRRVWRGEEIPDVVVEGDEARLQSTPVDDDRVTGKGDSWRGIGVSPGEAQGRARVLHRPEEGARLERGDILVAATTDPGWTPLFLRAGGIVTEIGGYLSHGAIVARELGVPAVANLPGAVTRLAEEPMIRIDGAKGQVSRIGPTYLKAREGVPAEFTGQDAAVGGDSAAYTTGLGGVYPACERESADSR